MLEEMPWLAIAGRWLIVLSFLAAAIPNLAPPAVGQHIGRLRGFGIPAPALAFWIGMGLELAGIALLASGWHAHLGAWLLIVFTVLATAIYHRYWTKSDPMQRMVSRHTLTGNTAIVGGLLALAHSLP